jgi:nitric-oxide synthase
VNLADSSTSPFQLPPTPALAGIKGMESLKNEARAFLDLMAADSVASAWIPDVTTRWRQIEHEIQSTGTYTHTNKELVFGARIAWRHSNRCIGRHFWRTLQVQDARDCTTPEQAHRMLSEHVVKAFNDGQIANVITVFPPALPVEEHPWRMLNHQLVRYAGFEQPDGSVMGDPDSVDLTKYCLKQGWNPRLTPWTPLPWVMVQNGKALPPFDPFHSGSLLPNEVILSHPDYPKTQDLGLRWYAVPILADMALKIGGIVYPFAPFNGHYLGTEIAARNLTDPDRYNVLEGWAEACGIDTKGKRNLWQDEALVRLNQALLASFDAAGVTVGDHHELGRAFEQWCQAEQRHGRDVPGDWSWLTPPMSGSLTPQFHRHFSNAVVTHTNYFYQAPAKVNGMTYGSKAKETHRLLAPDAFADDTKPKTCPFSSIGKHIQSLWK